MHGHYQSGRLSPTIILLGNIIIYLQSTLFQVMIWFNGSDIHVYIHISIDALSLANFLG